MHVLITLVVFTMIAADPPSPIFEREEIGAIEIGYGVAVGDVNGDAKPDILLADKKQFVWYRNPDWSRFVMAENLTQHDNVCIAARDINGDGMVEVAVGAQWNPGNTTDPEQSGSVHYLIRPDDPEDPAQRWEPIKLHHEPTVHRMRWVRDGDRFRLVVLPLHGRGNVNGEGEGVRILAYDMPDDPRGEWKTELLDDSLHVTHNFEVVSWDPTNDLVFAGREGLLGMSARASRGHLLTPDGMNRGAGEVRLGRLSDEGDVLFFVATIEPMHGNTLVAYLFDEAADCPLRRVLDDTMNQGHALACADVLGLGRDQIIAGWRNRNADGRVGIKLFIPLDESGTKWSTHLIDDNGIACEDLRVADLDGDGRLDIVASGRATRNLVIYWNRTE